MIDQTQSLLRALAKTDVLLELAPLAELRARMGHAPVLDATRRAIDALRRDILTGQCTALPTHEALAAQIAETLTLQQMPNLRPVYNATGVLLHTNLGRAPLAPQAAEAAAAVAANYNTLEYDCQTGGRGSRQSHVEQLLCRLCGCEAALVVNNNAAAVLLALAAMAHGREVIVSRGELVEIGGAFRVPEVMSQSGCVLREVGTTNKTHLYDYERAITPDTGALLKVHTSNYHIVGFTSDVSVPELCTLGKQTGVPVIYDLGSGAMLDLTPYGVREPWVQEAAQTGAELICFSGDKLLGGPQAGILIGSRAHIARLRAHPLNRAFRIDKMTLAALEATLQLYLDPVVARRDIPLLSMLCQERKTLHRRAQSFCAVLADLPDVLTRIVDSEGQVGGGSAPHIVIDSVAVHLASVHHADHDIAAALRALPRPIIVRIHKNQLLFDMRTLRDAEAVQAAQAVRALFEEGTL